MQYILLKDHECESTVRVLWHHDAKKQYQTSPWSCFTLKSISMITRLAPDVGFGLQHRANITWVTTSTLTSSSKYKQVQHDANMGDYKYINSKSVEVENIQHLQALE